MSAVVPSNSSRSNSEDSNTILNQLLECVKQCQKRYGGKTELATELDNCVAILSLSLEAVFLHGLRSKPCDSQQSSTFKQVSDIVSSSLNLCNDSLSFWPFVKHHLTKHERERYEVLKHIWTDTGRGRAWIRSTLNERSLERYFHTLLSNKGLLHIYYDDYALLCDDEKNSMLPNMAAGLGSILFAISIDKPELNSESTLQKSQRLKTQPEPIIEAPTYEPTKNRKKKYKVAKQLISFDDDDSVLSSSLPSSSNSITSETTEQFPNRMEYRIADTSQATHGVQREVKPKRKLSLEKSGSNDKFANIDGTLTPVEHSGVGELTPISVENSDNIASPNTSDEIIEVPSDISAILTAVESKNKEEVNKLCECISTLTNENEHLKEQIQKYLSAIQMLRRDEVSLNKALEGLQLEPAAVPDYKTEAQVFEKKLVQVAEMHAELMGFNVYLQQILCEKDNLLDRLKKELEDLRGPLPVDELSEDVRPNVNIWIPSAFLTGTGSDTHHVYQIFLRAGVDEWNIYRRYAQFHALHTDLKKLDANVSTFDFPPKKSLGKKDSSLVEDRRKRLQTYLRRILSHWPELSHCNSRFLLEQHLAFFKDPKPNDDKNKKNIFSSRRNPTNSNDNHYTGL